MRDRWRGAGSYYAGVIIGLRQPSLQALHLVDSDRYKRASSGSMTVVSSFAAAAASVCDQTTSDLRAAGQKEEEVQRGATSVCLRSRIMILSADDYRAARSTVASDAFYGPLHGAPKHQPALVYLFQLIPAVPAYGRAASQPAGREPSAGHRQMLKSHSLVGCMNEAEEEAFNCVCAFISWPDDLLSGPA